ncbi:MAG: hypothetical protein JXR69_03275 [Candidatus Delongbacteria bacterium]|nr:hypothetical protein [Candidatus Delongbacteria bacterium]
MKKLRFYLIVIILLFGSIWIVSAQEYDTQINSIFTSPSGTIYEGDTKTDVEGEKDKLSSFSFYYQTNKPLINDFILKLPELYLLKQKITIRILSKERGR